MGSDNLLNLIINAVDNASKTLSAVSGQVNALGASAAAASAQTDTLGTSLTKAGNSISSLGTKLLPVSLGAAAAIGLATKAAMDFSQTMELLHTQAGLSQSAVDGLKDSVLALAPTVGQSPDALATAFYHIASAGNGIWSTAQMLNILKIAAEGAAIGQANLDDTTYALTSALASNVKGASDAAQMMSVLNAIVGAGDMHMQDLNAAIGTGMLGTMATFGVSIQSVGAALATLGDNGEQGAAAATRLRMMVSLMASPSQAAAKILGDLGLTTQEVNTSTGQMNQVFAETGLTTTKLADDLRQPNGITVAIQDLQSHLMAAGLTASQTDTVLAKAFGGGRTDAALLQLLQNTDRLNAKFQDINASTNNFANDWASQQQQAAQQWKDFEAQVGVLAVKFGNDFLPALLNIAKALGGVADWFSNLSDSSRQSIADIVLFTAAFAPLLIVTGKVVASIGAIMKLSEGLAGVKAAVSGIGAAGDIAGGAGLLEAGAGLTGAGASLAALGSVAGPIALILAPVAYALYQQAKAAQEVDQATANATATIDKFGASQTLTKIFTDAHTNAVNNQKQATANLKGAQEAIAPSNASLLKSQQDLKTAQDNVTQAQQKYGSNSPQVISANQNLTNAQNNYYSAISNSANKTLDLMIAQGKLKSANDILRSATSQLNGWLGDENKTLGDITNTIAKMGPTAALQIQPIQGLGQNIADVVAKFNNAQIDIQGGVASDIHVLQNVGSTIESLQPAAKNLQSTIGGIKIQGGGTQGTGLQGGAVNNPVPGVYQAHADGGVFTTPSMGIVAEAGPEAIIPLNNPTRAREVMAEAGLGGNSGGVSIGNVTVNINAPAIGGTSAEARQFAYSIYQQLMSIAKSSGLGGNLPNIGVRPI